MTALFAALFAAASCSGDDPLVKPTPDTGQQVEGVATIFGCGTLTGEPGTPTVKTALDSKGHFYWSTGDNIFVDLGGGNYATAEGFQIGWKQARAEFWYNNALLENATYPVRFTGTGNTDPNSVTIAAAQVQELPNDGSHLGTDGDCGTATATRVNPAVRANYYQFNLDHKAAYLYFMPRTTTIPTGQEGFRLYEIKVEDEDGKSLCGTYDFSSGSIDASSVTGEGSAITLTCAGETGFLVKTETDTASNGAFIAIQPGSHKLKITYYFDRFKVQKNIWNGSVWTFDYESHPISVAERTIDTRNYAEGSMLVIGHKLTPSSYDDTPYQFEGLYYQWDAKKAYWDSGWEWWSQPDDVTFNPNALNPVRARHSETFGDYDFPRRNNEYYIIWRGFSGDVWHRGNVNWYFSDTRPQVLFSGNPWPKKMYFAGYNGNFRAKGEEVELYPGYTYVHGRESASDMPNANELAWYVKRGDPHYDTETLWLLQGFNDGETFCSGGVWLLKKEYIAGFSSDKTPPDAMDESPDATYWAQLGDDAAVDLRLSTPINVVKETYTKRGRPADSELHKYFFLPNLGYIQNEWAGDSEWDMRQLKLVGVRGAYWSGTPLPFFYTNNGEYLLSRVGISEHLPLTSAGQKYDNSAYYLYINENYISVSWEQQNLCRWGMVAGHRPDGTNWFQ